MAAGEVPHWAHRPHVAQGYRRNLTAAQCLCSLFTLHNETGNIWTHVLGCALALRLAIAAMDQSWPHRIPWDQIVPGDGPVALSAGAGLGGTLEAQAGGERQPLLGAAAPGEHLVICTFLWTAALAFGTSSLYHLGNCGSERLSACLLRLDLSGIALLIASSFFGGVRPFSLSFSPSLSFPRQPPSLLV